MSRIQGRLPLTTKLIYTNGEEDLEVNSDGNERIIVVVLFGN